MTSLAVIVPTRGRPHAVAELVAAWEETGATAALVFAVDDDDPCLPDYRAAVAGLDDEHDVELVIGRRLRMIGTLNAVAVWCATRFDALGFMGDDHRPRTPGWDTEILADMAVAPRIVYGNDLYQREQMATAVFLTSDIVRALGYMSPPTFRHLKADLVWVAWGAAINRLTYRPDVIIEHCHPDLGKAAWDAGYEECNNDATWAHDDAAYAEYMTGGEFHRDVEKLKALT